jgi:hypothetical protein
VEPVVALQQPSDDRIALDPRRFVHGSALGRELRMDFARTNHDDHRSRRTMTRRRDAGRTPGSRFSFRLRARTASHARRFYWGWAARTRLAFLDAPPGEPIGPPSSTERVAPERALSDASGRPPNARR